MKYLIVFIAFIFNVYGSCQLIDKDNLIIIEKTKEFNIALDNKKYILSTNTVKKKTLDAKPYKVFCLNSERIVSGYPFKKHNRYSKVKSIYEDLFEVNNKYIAFKDNKKIIFFNLDNYKFKVLNISNIKKILPLSDDFLIDFYSNLTKSIDLKILNVNTMKYKIIATKYDDIARNIDYNNFVLDLVKNTSGVKKSVKNSIKLPYEISGSYIINKNLEIISFKQKDINKSIEQTFNDVNGKLVHGKSSKYIAIISLIFVIIAIYLTKKSVQSFKLPTTLSLFMLFYLIYVYLGATILNIFYFEYEFNTHLYERKDLLLNIWIYSSIALILIPLGAFSVKLILNRNNDISFIKFFDKKIEYPLNNHLFIMNISIFIVAVFSLLFYIYKIKYLPIIGVFMHLDPLELAQLRSNAGNNFSGHLYRYVLFYRNLPLLILLITFFLKDISKKWNYLFLALLLFNIFIAIMDINKAPLINLIIILLIAFFYKKRYIDWKLILIFAIISFIGLVVMYIAFMGGSKEGILSTLSAPFHRAVIGSISPLFWWQLYIEQNGLLHGLTMPNPHHIFNFEHVKISVKVMEFAHTELKDYGIVGSMPVVFFAEWYANFGWSVAIFSMFLFGILLYLIDYLFIKLMLKRKSAIILALYIYIIYYFKQFNVTSISGIIFNIYLIIPLLIGFIMYYISNFKRLK